MNLTIVSNNYAVYEKLPSGDEIDIGRGEWPEIPAIGTTVVLGHGKRFNSTKEYEVVAHRHTGVYGWRVGVEYPCQAQVIVQRTAGGYEKDNDERMERLSELAKALCKKYEKEQYPFKMKFKIITKGEIRDKWYVMIIRKASSTVKEEEAWAEYRQKIDRETGQVFLEEC